MFGIERLISEIWTTSFNHLFKNRFNCPGKNLEISFLWKNSICVRFFEMEQELSGHSVKKGILAVKTALYVSWGTLWGVFVEWNFFFHFRTLRKKNSDFCSLKTPMLSELHSTNPKILFWTFYGRISFPKLFSDFERNSFTPLRTLYSQNCSRILGKNLLIFQKKTSAGLLICILRVHRFFWWTYFWNCSKLVFCCYIWVVKIQSFDKITLTGCKPALFDAWAVFWGNRSAPKLFFIEALFPERERSFQTFEKRSQHECRSWFLPVQGKTFLESFLLNNFPFCIFFRNMGKKMSNSGINFLVGSSEIRE